MWKFLLPYRANDFCVLENLVDSITGEIGAIGKEFYFEDVDSSNVRVRLDSNSQSLTDTDLTDLD
jgi:hypothetical protein